jgi:molybdate transport system regulatory protein
MGQRLNQPKGKDRAVLSLRIDFAEGRRLGPGKVLLLEAVHEHGSISAAGRAIGMSYKRAWDLVDEMNRMFAVPVVESKSGGKQGGGATLTELGQRVVGTYRLMEENSAEVNKAAMVTLLKDVIKPR